MNTIYDRIQLTRRILTIVTSAILGGGFLFSLVYVVYTIGLLLERLPK